MSFTPAFMAEVNWDAVYLLDPHVTVPEGRERSLMGTTVARAADAVETRRIRERKETMALKVQEREWGKLGDAKSALERTSAVQPVPLYSTDSS